MTSKSVGRPRSRGLSDSDDWVFAVGKKAVRGVGAFDSTQDDVYSDAFIGGLTTQAVNAGQVDQFGGEGPEFNVAGVFFHRNAGVVAGGLAQAGEPVEQRAFTRVRVTDYGK